MDLIASRRQVLEQMGAKSAEIDELLAYNTNSFSLLSTSPIQLPLPDEPFIKSWQAYEHLSQSIGVYEALKTVLVQLHFPIVAGISQSAAYLDATKRGIFPQSSRGLELKEPASLVLKIHPTAAGHIPVLFTPNRSDFVSLIQTLAARNEPTPIPPSMGAATIKGYNNWGRISSHLQKTGGDLASVLPHKEVYQDRFIILSQGPYSGVNAQEIGLDAKEWQNLSFIIRLEHESTHYLTGRLLSSMKNNLFDELLADYAGIVAAKGHFDASWFLLFLGLENFPNYRAGGRLENYVGETLSPTSVEILRHLIVDAAHNLEAFDQRTQIKGPEGILALSTLTLEELASRQAQEKLREALKSVEGRVQLAP